MTDIEQTTLLKIPPVIYPALARDILESPRAHMLTEEQKKELQDHAENE
jgi:hypothetical protein